MGIKIYGASDDLIEIEGDFEEELNFFAGDSDEFRFLAVSDGTLLKIWYDNDGIWRITRVSAGQAEYSKVEGDVEADTPDIVELSGVKIKWVLLGYQLAK